MSTILLFSARTNRLIREILMSVVAAGIASGTIATGATAQTTIEQPHHWEFRASSGALVPTGAARNTLKDAALSTAQLSYLIRPSFAITGTLGWARSRDRSTDGQPKVDAFLYDLGAELRIGEVFANKPWALAPFVGAGAGAQSLNYRSLDLDATHNIAGYATVGSETGFRRVRLRIEVRDYVTGFKPLSGVGETATHNDVVFMAALRLTKRSSRSQ